MQPSRPRHARPPRLGAAARLALASLAAFACGGGDGPTASGPRVSVVRIEPGSKDVFVGASVTFTASARDVAQADVPGATFTWSSSDTGVARVGASGSVLGRREGTATITAQSGLASATAQVHVLAAPAPSTISLTLPRAALLVGETVQIAATIASQYGTPLAGSQPEAWRSSDDRVATVDAAGLVRAVGLGVAMIAATAGDARAEAHVTVVAPLPLAGGARVAAGARHSCALDDDGAAYCWGYNEWGQIGLGVHDPAGVLLPTPVSGGLRFASIAANGLHSCALTVDGAAYCWGGNRRGQLGAPSTENCATATSPEWCSGRPLRVEGAPPFALIAPGFEHTCALTADGVAYCWGAGESLGTGDAVSSFTPRAVAGGYRFVALASGDYHSCGLTATGEAYCWGEDYWGQVGDGTPSGNELNSVKTILAPRAVAGGLRFRSIAASRAETCAVAADGGAHCWGYYAKVWHGDAPPAAEERNRMESTVPLPVLGASELGLQKITVGNFLTCGLTSAGTAWCWGWLQSASGTIERRILPPEPLAPVSYRELAAGGAHRCGIGSDGALYCGGANHDGQIGDGTTEWRETAVRITLSP